MGDHAPPVTVNPSYFSPATSAALRAASGDPRWDGLAASSRAITSKLMSGPGAAAARLGAGSRVTRRCRSATRATPRRRRSSASMPFARWSGWPRIRTRPGGGSPPGHGRCSQNQDPTKLPVRARPLRDGRSGNTLHPVVLVAAAGAADAAGQPAARDGLLDEAEALDRRSPTYYGAAWVALGRLMLTTKLLDRLLLAAGRPLSGDSPTASSTRRRGRPPRSGGASGALAIARRITSSSAGGHVARAARPARAARR